MCSQKQGLKKAIATFAKGKGLDHAKHCQLGEDGAYPGGYGVAEKLVLSKVDSKPAHMPVFTHALTHTSTCTHLYSRMRHACHSTRSTNTTQCMHAHLSRTPQHMHARLTQIKAALGLDQCKFGFTGAAPITVDTLEYFGQLGIQINEVYGMSECTGATTWSLDRAHVWGSCGGSHMRACPYASTPPRSQLHVRTRMHATMYVHTHGRQDLRRRRGQCGGVLGCRGASRNRNNGHHLRGCFA